MTSFHLTFINNYYLYYNTNEPKYLLNDNKELLQGQLIDFTIHHICEHFNIPIQNELGTIMPNNYLVNIIKEYKIKKLPDDCDICKKLGIYFYPKIKNNFSYNNIGGHNKSLLQLDISQNYINFNIEPFFISDQNNIPIMLPIDYRFLQEISQKELSKSDKKPFLKGLIDKIQKERSSLGLENILKGTTPLEKLGKIDYSINSSYIDTIIMLFNIPFPNDFFENIFNIQQRINKLNKQTYLSLHFKNLPRSDLTKKLLDCNRVINEYKEKILNGEILNIQKLRITIQTYLNNPGILKHNYYLSQKKYPIFDFYKDFLKINLIDNYPYTTLHKYFIERNLPNIFSGSNSLQPDMILHDKIEGINQNTEHIGFEIKGEIMKYLITGDRFKQPAESRIYCPICNEFINRFDKKHMNFHKSNKILLSILMDFKIDIINDEYIPQPDISMKENMFFNNQNPDKLYSLQEAITEGMVSKYERAIYNYSIYDTQCISFFLNRFEKVINKQSHMEETNHVQNIPVEIEEIIIDKNGNNYILTAVITESLTNNLLFFKLNTTWYVYNSMFDPELHSDYIQTIGNIHDLINYRDGIIQTTGVIYYYLRQ